MANAYDTKLRLFLFLHVFWVRSGFLSRMTVSRVSNSSHIKSKSDTKLREDAPYKKTRGDLARLRTEDDEVYLRYDRYRTTLNS